MAPLCAVFDRMRRSALAVLVFFFVFSSCVRYLPAHSTDTLTSMSEMILQPYGTYVFPDSVLSEIEDATSFAENLSRSLDLSSPSRASAVGSFALDPSFLHLLDREVTSLDPNPYVFEIERYPVLLYRALSYSCGAANLTLCYDNLGSVKNVFRAFSLAFGFSGPVAANSSQYLPIAWSVVDALGLPHENLTVAVYDSSSYSVFPATDLRYDPDWLNHSTIMWYNRTTIVMQSSLSNYSLGGCNQLGFLFNDDYRQLLEVECAAFVTLPTSTSLSPPEALDVGRKTIPTLFYNQSRDKLVADEIVGIRLFPTVDSPGMGSNTSESNDVNSVRLLRFAYVYVAHVAIDRYSGYSLYVIVDVDSGIALCSMRSLPWVASGGGSGLSGEPIIIAVARWSPLIAVLLTIVVIIAGPLEFSLLFLGSFVAPTLIRLHGLNVLDNFNRGRIYGYIRGKPGCTFSDLKTELKMLNGNLAYHLAILEKVGMIKSVKDGRSRRHFADDAVGRIRPESFLGKAQSMVLSKLRSVGSVSTTKVAEALGMSRQRAHYNLKRLMRRGLVESTSMGWRVVELGNEEGET